MLGRCDNHYTTAPLIICSRLSLIDCLVVMLSGNGSASCQHKTSIHASVAQSAARQSHNESKCKSDLKVVSSSLTRGKIFIFRLFFHDSVIKKYPSNRIRTSDLRMSALHSPLQSSALPTELSRDDADARQQKSYNSSFFKKKMIAADGFDPSTSGLWAQHASTAPRCCHGIQRKVADADAQKEKKFTKPRCVPCLWRRRKKRKRPIRDLNP